MPAKKKTPAEKKPTKKKTPAEKKPTKKKTSYGSMTAGYGKEKPKEKRSS